MLKLSFVTFILVLIILNQSAHCKQTSTTVVIGKLIAAFGKCGLKVGLIDAHKLQHIMQIKHGFQHLDPKQIV